MLVAMANVSCDNDVLDNSNCTLDAFEVPDTVLTSTSHQFLVRILRNTDGNPALSNWEFVNVMICDEYSTASTTAVEDIANINEWPSERVVSCDKEGKLDCGWVCFERVIGEDADTPDLKVTVRANDTSECRVAVCTVVRVLAPNCSHFGQIYIVQKPASDLALGAH